jgi:toxin-antitoxin system PIN domain toxin
LPKRPYLLDVNTLIALVDEEHEHHYTVLEWFDSASVKETGWAVCPFVEAALVRIMSGPRYPSTTIDEAFEILAQLQEYPGYKYWPISDSILSVTRPLRERIFGYKQITDAYLLGLAIKRNGVLVTLDKGIEYLAGPRYQQHLCLLSEAR